MKVNNIIFMMGLLIGLIGLTTQVAVAQISICNSDANFTATATSFSGASNMDYVLVQPDGITIEASNNTGTFAVPADGVYTLYAINHDGTANLAVVPPTGACLEIVTQTITINEAICPPPSACENESITVSATAVGGESNMDYMLVCGGTITSTNASGTFDLEALGVSSGTCDVYAVNHNGTANLTVAPPTGSCLEYIVESWTILDAPIISTIDVSNSCPDATGDLTTAVTSSDGGTLAYFSDLGLSIAVPNPTAVVAGTYYIASTIGSCTDSEAVTVTINACPVGGIVSCNTDATFSATASGAFTTGAYELTYVLVQSDGITVEATSTDGTFNTPVIGVYTIYAVNHDGNADFSAWPLTATTCYEEVNQTVTIENCCGASAVILTPLGTTAAPANCLTGPWTYYYDSANPGDMVFAIEWAPDGTLSTANSNAKASTMITIDKDPTYDISPTSGLGEITWTMERYWNVDIAGNTLDEPVNVKFFYDAAEHSAIITAANIAATPLNIYEGIEWFKTVGVAFDPNAHNTTGGSVGGLAIPLVNVNPGGLTENGVLYAQFNGILSFSGGTATSGIGPNDTPLPVELLSFIGQAEEKSNVLYWATTSEINSDYFDVEYSKDGFNFEGIGNVAAQGESAIQVDYRLIHEEPSDIAYYRLKMVDLDGTYEYSNVVLIKRDTKKSLTISNIRPVPTIDQATVVFTAYNNGPIEFSIMDITGKVLDRKRIEAIVGENQYTYDFSKYPSAVYIVTLNNGQAKHVMRMVKN
jgi:hypothetical protein